MTEIKRVGVDFTYAGTVGPFDFQVPTLDELRALHALNAGTANEQQQKLALMWILNGACAVQSEVFSEKGAEVISYNSGRRGAGLRILRAIGMKPEQVRKTGETDI